MEGASSILNFFKSGYQRLVEVISSEKEELKLYTCDEVGSASKWKEEVLQNPLSLDEVAMEAEEKEKVVGDLETFVSHRDYSKSIKKPWRRGYIVCGPPQTGKTTLAAAISNYLKFDLYLLDMKDAAKSTALKKLVYSIHPRSVLAIRDSSDIDISPTDLLNGIHDQWSTSGFEECLLVFTTEDEERINRNALRPCCIDVTISLSFLCGDGFQLLATRFPNVCKEEKLLKQIQELLTTGRLTPSWVIEELSRRTNAQKRLKKIVTLLKRSEEAYSSN